MAAAGYHGCRMVTLAVGGGSTAVTDPQWKHDRAVRLLGAVASIFMVPGSHSHTPVPAVISCHFSNRCDRIQR